MHDVDNDAGNVIESAVRGVQISPLIKNVLLMDMHVSILATAFSDRMLIGALVPATMNNLMKNVVDSTLPVLEFTNKLCNLRYVNHNDTTMTQSWMTVEDADASKYSHLPVWRGLNMAPKNLLQYFN